MLSDQNQGEQNEHSNLSKLDKVSQPTRELEAFPNRNPERNYIVELSSSEFACLCPMTGQPDFADITIIYIPEKIVESKSLKLYFWSFRDQGIFHEHVSTKC